jgi:hypothetical protein
MPDNLYVSNTKKLSGFFKCPAKLQKNCGLRIVDCGMKSINHKARKEGGRVEWES